MVGRDPWPGVDRLIDSARSESDLQAHRLHLLAARRWREADRPVPASLSAAELLSSRRQAAAMTVLNAVRDAYDGPVLVLKGPSTAAFYPDPTTRPSSDLDVLVDDAEGAQRVLLDAGFEPLGDRDDSYYEGLHHLRPLGLPGGVPTVLEVHRRPNWIEWLEPPPVHELLAAATDGLTGAPGVLTLAPVHHALVLVAHSWAESPLRRLLDLVDIAAVTAVCEQDEVDDLANAWGLTRIWDTTMAAIDGLLYGKRLPWSLRLWARDLVAVRDRTVLEDHVRRWLSPFWALPAREATPLAVRAFARNFTPAPNETWGNRWVRAREALLHPTRRSQEHVKVIGPGGIRPRHKRR